MLLSLWHNHLSDLHLELFVLLLQVLYEGLLLPVGIQKFGTLGLGFLNDLLVLIDIFVLGQGVIKVVQDLGLLLGCEVLNDLLQQTHCSSVCR